MTQLAFVSGSTTNATFLRVFNRLCVALREPQDDSGATQGVYFDALKDLPLDALEAGARALMTEPGRRFFPTTAEWRTAAEKAHAVQLRKAVEPEPDRGWSLECSHCEDTGWELFRCTGNAECGRANNHAPHDFVRVCSCRPTNRTFQRHHLQHTPSCA